MRYRIYTGKYNPGKDGSMVDYVLKLARQARALNTPMEEKEIVTRVSLARHFEDGVARELRPVWVKTVEQLTDILHYLETEKTIKRD